MIKVAIIVVWIGKIPNYFPLWTRSLIKNKNYDFFLITDQIIDLEIKPENLKVITATLLDLKKDISSKLRIPVFLELPYKLCDFKPAYGEIFHQQLANYDFWGTCDMDMMFGDLDKFLNHELYQQYSKLFSRGHLTLYKNSKEINKLYRSSKLFDYKHIFSSPACFMFDEWYGIHKIFEEFGIAQYANECMADINANTAGFTCTNIKNFEKQIFVWENGDLKQYYLNKGIINSRELAYIHFQKRKISINSININSAHSIILNAAGVFGFEEEITSEVIEKYNVKNYKHFFERQYKRLKNKVPVLKNDSIIFDKSLKKK